MVLVLALTSPAFSQGAASSGAQARPKRPLPEGVVPPKVDYRDIAKDAGLTRVIDSGAPMGKVFIVESTGTGVALFDFDNDGLLDIFFVNGGQLSKDDQRAPGRPGVYAYRNLGDLKFKEVTAEIGVAHDGWGQGTCAGDMDNDGWTDLVVTHWGRTHLFRNQGDGTFSEEAEGRGISMGERWSSGCAFLDHDRDGDLDLFVANYLDFDPKQTPKPGEHAQCRWKGIPVLCGPRGLPGETMTLYRNDGAGNFKDISDEAGISGDKVYYGFTPLTADYDNDGWTDIYVACDSTASLFYQNLGDGTFEEVGVISGTAYNMDGMEQAGMGATAADFDADGDLDIFKTNFSNDTHTLYRNDGDLMFMDETVSTGLAVNTQFLGWGTAFIDIDHDGFKDIFVANGHVYPGIDNAKINEKFRQQRLIYWSYRHQRKGSKREARLFHDISEAAGPGIMAKYSSRGIAVADLDNDGTMEIVAVNMHDTPSLLKNFGETGNSLLVEARTATGRHALGARIKVTANGHAQIDDVRSGGNHISQSDFRIHYGLADADKADIAIRWPDGKSDSFTGVAANQWVEIRQCTKRVKDEDGKEVEVSCAEVKSKKRFPASPQATTEAASEPSGS